MTQPNNQNNSSPALANTRQTIDWEHISTLLQTERLTPTQRGELREILNRTPAIARVLPDLGQRLRTRIIEELIQHDGTAGLLLRQAELLAADLAGGTATAMERMLIDVVVIAWLRWQAAEWRYQDSAPGSQGAQERSLTAAQNRHLRACESLARVRRLLVRSPVQINIAAQQVVANHNDPG